jgi:hypothetical protein
MRDRKTICHALLDLLHGHRRDCLVKEKEMNEPISRWEGRGEASKRPRKRVPVFSFLFFLFLPSLLDDISLL